MRKLFALVLLTLALSVPSLAQTMYLYNNQGPTYNERIDNEGRHMTYLLGGPDSYDWFTIGTDQYVYAHAEGGSFPSGIEFTMQLDNVNTSDVYYCPHTAQSTSAVIFKIPGNVVEGYYDFNLIETDCAAPCTVYRTVRHFVPKNNIRTHVESVNVGGTYYDLLKGSLYGYTVSPANCIIGITPGCTITGTEYIKSLSDGTANPRYHNHLGTIMQAYVSGHTPIFTNDWNIYWLSNSFGRNFTTYIVDSNDSTLRVLNFNTPTSYSGLVYVEDGFGPPYYNGFGYPNTSLYTNNSRTKGYLYLGTDNP